MSPYNATFASCEGLMQFPLFGQSEVQTWKPTPTAQRILLDTYWSSTGWKSHPSISPEDRRVAEISGYMFDPVTLHHDEVVRRLIEMRERVSARNVGEAFADSLVTGRLDLRSALGSYGAALNLPKHKLGLGSLLPGASMRCSTCFAFRYAQPEDVNILNFERFKWGGVRHSEPLYGLFDLSRFALSAPQTSSGEGFAVLERLLEIAGGAAPDARPNDLVKMIKSLVPGNDHVRRALIGCLGYAGVLQPAGHDGFFEGYPKRRDDPPEWKNDWPYPVSWWRGRDGVNAEAVRIYFPWLKA